MPLPVLCWIDSKQQGCPTVLKGIESPCFTEMKICLAVTGVWNRHHQYVNVKVTKSDSKRSFFVWLGDWPCSCLSIWMVKSWKELAFGCWIEDLHIKIEQTEKLDSKLFFWPFIGETCNVRLGDFHILGELSLFKSVFTSCQNNKRHFEKLNWSLFCLQVRLFRKAL